MKIPLAVIVTAAVLLSGCTPATTGALDTTLDAARSTTVIPTTTPVTTTTTTAPAPAAPETCTVPDVVGMVHQNAQDTMQAAGLYNLREQDSTGQGRALVLDRNWTTTAQSVAAGQAVDCMTEILLSAKKTGE
ncbi:PASTA domain-containing protein [Saccharothrix sp. NRRL B-16348]|uniref:PASTA domain-containing protein n=1 Tax=Saccharothrix sp. NRRL B-16348 TaxID=1415542 RepID=UPI000A670D2C|nr:PASTA domain-containing protein [Saccharothrix sp. NRRL B-16348]